MAWFGTGETRLCSLVSKDRSYKPVVKSSGAQRESDGVVVPSGELLGKGPDFGRASGAGTREGMAGTTESKLPGGRAPPEKVRRLQRKLWAAAKQSEGRRFHALYDQICRDDVLVEAWRRVRANRGAAGVDGVTLEAVRGYGVERMLGELACDLRAGVYRPALVRRVEIPKPDGRKRPLGIPTVRDRVCQQAVKLVLEPVCSRLTSCPAASGSVRGGRPPMPWKRSGWRSLGGGSLSLRPTSGTSSGRSTMRGCSRWSRNASRIGGC